MSVESRERTVAPVSLAEQASTSPGERTERVPRFSVGSVTRGFTALRVRNYRLFWIGQLISLTGSWMQTTAQAWLVLELTQSPFALGLVTIFQFLPIMLLSLVGGVITDRLPKQRLLYITNTAALLQATIFGILVATGTIQVWHVCVLAAIQGIINAIDQPTRQAFVPELVGRDNLVNAVALNSMLFNGARIIGPAVAGIVIATIGIAPALLMNAASFIAVIVVLAMMRMSELFAPKQAQPGGIRERLVEGLRYSWRTPPVLMIMILIAAIGTFGYNFSVVLPLVANFILHTGPDGFGELSAFMGVGSLVAALSTAYARQVTIRRLMVGAGGFSVLLGAMALSTNFGLTAVLLIALGFAGILFTTSANTRLQLIVPDELRGRVISLYILLGIGSTPVGGLFIGTLSNVIGVPGTLVVCASLCLAGVIVALIYHRKTAIA